MKSSIQINKTHHLNNQQTHSSKAILVDSKEMVGPALSMLHHSDYSMLQHQTVHSFHEKQK